jgi:integrase
VPSPAPRRKSKELPFGSIRIPYQEYRNASGRYWMLFYYEAGQRKQECRSSFAALKKRAEEIATNIANGQTAMTSFTETDRARWLVVCENFAKTGIAPETGSAEYAAARQRLLAIGDGRLTISDALTFFEETHPRGFLPKPLPDLVAQFLTEQEGQISDGWHEHLSHCLNQLAAHFKCSLHTLQSADLNAWLRGLNVGPRTRHNYRAALDQLVRWAQSNGHVPRTWSEMERVADPGAKLGEIKILTPEQMTRLIAERQRAEEFGRAQKTLVPFLALQAFAGLRHSEAARTDWRDIHLEERHVYVPKAIAKGGHDRLVPMSDTLAAWLQPYARRNGPATSLSQVSGALTKAKKAAEIPAGDNETKNVLRKSFISYRLAVTKNIAQVAEEAGNSPGIIRKHYGRPLPESEGKRWFGIWPTAAAVLQLNFAGLLENC